MPSPAHAARRPPFPKAQYRVSNWREYDRAWQERGSLTVWVTPENASHGFMHQRPGDAQYVSDTALLENAPEVTVATLDRWQRYSEHGYSPNLKIQQPP